MALTIINESRQASPDCEIDATKTIVRPVHNLAELQEVYRLTHACYVTSGYSAPHPSGMLIHYPHFDHLAETTILVAVNEGRIVGSISATLDGLAGFTLEDEFKSACDTIRQEGPLVATIWRLVVEKSARSQRGVVMALIDGIASRMMKAGIGSYLFAVNPKHEMVYRRMLHMEVLARTEHTEGLENAPAVLLRGHPEEIPAMRAAKMHAGAQAA